MITDYVESAYKKAPNQFVQKLEASRTKLRIQRTNRRNATYRVRRKFKPQLKKKGKHRLIDPYYGENAEKPELDVSEFEVLEAEKIEEICRNSEDRKNIEQRTTSQSDSILWGTIRRSLITSSNFGVILKSQTRSFENKVKMIMYPSDLSNVPAIAHGRTFEKEALLKFESVTKTKVQKCGLFIWDEIKYLGSLKFLIYPILTHPNYPIKILF